MTSGDFGYYCPRPGRFEAYTASEPFTSEDIKAARNAGWWVGFSVGFGLGLGGVLLGAICVWFS